ncbi:hypothetical protein SDC9_192221 [bioreactor metagenome]|uniref:Uncharacterized protein n=1 Tax=bioreactor metagenome TaxID=1076179 RepID=A0A645I1D1_9ZZZZ
MLHIASMPAPGHNGKVGGRIAPQITKKGVAAFVPGYSFQIIITPFFFCTVLGNLVGLVQNSVGQRRNLLYGHAAG